MIQKENSLDTIFRSGVKDISLSSGLVDSHRVGEITTARHGASNLSELRSVALAD